mmetsp:Transcript_10028/g.16870  ORF Transcript_10028/g.16870 Transcript_10028/m.16870 type:complete len:191 (-) Transcript_10028:810-1382(-)
MKSLLSLPKGMIGQDGGHPWFLFWNSHSFELLNQPNLKLDDELKRRCTEYLAQCHNGEEGGFRGAPFIMSHVASSYAAIMAIVNLGTKEAYDLVDLTAMKAYLLSVKNNFKARADQPNLFSFMSNSEFSEVDGNDPSRYIGTLPGSIAIHLNGEMDIRGIYCSLVCADVLGLLEDNEEFTKDIGRFLLGC